MQIRATLRHEYEVQGSNTVQIVFEETSVQLVGSALFGGLPKLELPQLPEAFKPPRNFRSATFQVRPCAGGAPPLMDDALLAGAVVLNGA